MKKCVFAGTFDPPTIGHENVVKKSLQIFDEVVVALMVNGGKNPLLTQEQRFDLLKTLFADQPRVRVITFAGAACDLLRAENTPFYVRGVRDAIDVAYENRDYYATKRLMPEVIEIYLPAEQEQTHISSSLVKTSARLDKEYLDYIPEAIRQNVAKILEKKHV